MKIITLTVKMAFEDWDVGHQWGDAIADDIHNYCAETLGPEVLRITKQVKDIDFPDFTRADMDATEEEIDDWQKRAAAEFEK